MHIQNTNPEALKNIEQAIHSNYSDIVLANIKEISTEDAFKLLSNMTDHEVGQVGWINRRGIISAFLETHTFTEDQLTTLVRHQIQSKSFYTPVNEPNDWDKSSMRSILNLLFDTGANQSVQTLFALYDLTKIHYKSTAREFLLAKIKEKAPTLAKHLEEENGHPLPVVALDDDQEAAFKSLVRHDQYTEAFNGIETFTNNIDSNETRRGQRELMASIIHKNLKEIKSLVNNRVVRPEYFIANAVFSLEYVKALLSDNKLPIYTHFFAAVRAATARFQIEIAQFLVEKSFSTPHFYFTGDGLSQLFFACIQDGELFTYTLDLISKHDKKSVNQALHHLMDGLNHALILAVELNDANKVRQVLAVIQSHSAIDQSQLREAQKRTTSNLNAEIFNQLLVFVEEELTLNETFMALIKSNHTAVDDTTTQETILNLGKALLARGLKPFKKDLQGKTLVAQAEKYPNAAALVTYIKEQVQPSSVQATENSSSTPEKQPTMTTAQTVNEVQPKPEDCSDLDVYLEQESSVIEVDKPLTPVRMQYLFAGLAKKAHPYLMLTLSNQHFTAENTTALAQLIKQNKVKDSLTVNPASIDDECVVELAKACIETTTLTDFCLKLPSNEFVPYVHKVFATSQKHNPFCRMTLLPIPVGCRSGQDYKSLANQFTRAESIATKLKSNPDLSAEERKAQVCRFIELEQSMLVRSPLRKKLTALRLQMFDTTAHPYRFSADTIAGFKRAFDDNCNQLFLKPAIKINELPEFPKDKTAVKDQRELDWAFDPIDNGFQNNLLSDIRQLALVNQTPDQIMVSLQKCMESRKTDILQRVARTFPSSLARHTTLDESARKKLELACLKYVEDRTSTINHLWLGLCQDIINDLCSMSDTLEALDTFEVLKRIKANTTVSVGTASAAFYSQPNTSTSSTSVATGVNGMAPVFSEFRKP